MANIKISQLPAKGANLGASDLVEISEFTGTGYVSKSITGQEIIDAVAPAPTAWGDITGTLSSQTDLNTALSGKQATLVSGTNIKTINSTSLLGSGNITTASVNATSGKIPYNNSGVFADSSITNDTTNKRNVSNFNYRVNRLTADGASKLDLFTNANGGLTNLTGGTGIQWGVTNFDPGLGVTDFNDCSIVVDTAIAGGFGSPLYFKTQNTMGFSPSSVDTQVTKLSIVPGNFITQNGGIGVLTQTPNCALHVSQSGSRPGWQNNNAIARFDWNMGGVVFPNVTTSNRGMMTAELGMVIYNSTTNKLQVYNGAWVDLH